MFPLAVVCGNTFVLKPSEKVPLTAVMLVQLLEKAGLPKGVLNLVHGGRECVDRATHTSEGEGDLVCRLHAGGATHLRDRTRHGKRVQANGGAKNYIVVMPDADVPRTVESLSTARSAALASVAWLARRRSPSGRQRNDCSLPLWKRRVQSRSGPPTVPRSPTWGR
jgi:acyl-CoA reductase-like NAD-dependent aldehyde dehydrogenase